MWKQVVVLCTALLAFGADDPWAKVKELKSGAELRVYKKGSAQPLTVKMGDLTDDNLVVVDKNKETAIARDLIDRIDARPTGKPRIKSETTTKDNSLDPKAAIPPSGMNGVQGPGSSSSTNTNVSLGSKPDFETVYRRPPSPPKK